MSLQKQSPYNMQDNLAPKVESLDLMLFSYFPQ